MSCGVTTTPRSSLNSGTFASIIYEHTSTAMEQATTVVAMRQAHLLWKSRWGRHLRFFFIYNLFKNLIDQRNCRIGCCTLKFAACFCSRTIRERLRDFPLIEGAFELCLIVSLSGEQSSLTILPQDLDSTLYSAILLFRSRATDSFFYTIILREPVN